MHDVKTLKNIAAVACVTALAVPAGVSAKGPSGDHGKSGQHKQTTQTHVSQRCKNQPKVGLVLGGTLDPSSTADNIVVDVKSSNKHSRQFVVDGKFAVPAGSTTTFDGANPFTTAGADLSKYKVKVLGKVMKFKAKCTAANAPAPTVRKVKVTAPEATTQQQPAAQSA
ncbi:MAG TPA: hypothetical protein VE570_05275 [Thermoleophilaceae bacterium]|jgi:hypothetical protein|nr:hypothetical protein [Thermoleophilaceae bacterium]